MTKKQVDLTVVRHHKKVSLPSIDRKSSWFDYDSPKNSKLIMNWNEENVSKIKLTRK